MRQERATLERFFPGLDETLSRVPLMEMEREGNPSLRIFREYGGTALCIPAKYAGLGATPLEAVRIQRALGCRAPSLAVATTMHHFSVAIFMELCALKPETDFQSPLEEVARQNLYMASGFAEGQAGRSLLSSKMEASPMPDGLLLSGSKMPCSLAASMDLLTASVIMPGDSDDELNLAVVVIAADSPGLEREPFWSNWVLAGTESDRVVLKDVFVPQERIAYFGNTLRLDAVQAKCFIWFELLISAAYLGVATNLVERVIEEQKGLPTERTLLATEVEGAMAALEGVCQMMSGEQGDAEIARSLFVRYTVQRAIERATPHALELLGGMSFVTSQEIAYLYAASRALAFHPPSRLSVATGLDKYLAGGPFIRSGW